MRAAIVLAVVAATAVAAGQSPHPDVSVFLSVKADVLITVSKQKMGGDLVDVIPVDKNYPPELLAKQIQALSSYLGSQPRGLQMFRYQIEQNRPDMTFLEATFGVDGVIDRERGRLAILPFLKAFAGAPSPYTIHGVSLIFNDERATTRTIRTYKSSSVRAEAITSTSPLSIEYRIELLTQDPREMSFPDEYTKPPEETAPQARANRPALIMTLFTAAALAGGALVYLALLRGAPPARSKPTK